MVASLLHDVTESLQPKAHGEAIAALLLPYLSPEAHFVLFHHETCARGGEAGRAGCVLMDARSLDACLRKRSPALYCVSARRVLSTS